MIPQDVMSAAFVPLPSHEGSMLVTGTRSGEILLWSLDRGLECKRFVRAHQVTSACTYAWAPTWRTNNGSGLRI